SPENLEFRNEIVLKPSHCEMTASVYSSTVSYISMTAIRLISAYTTWHFGIAFRELYEFWKNLIWFGYHFFSLPLLFKTLIRPIYRIHESAPAGTGLNVELFFENITVNIIARIVGFFLRIFLILCGMIYQAIILIIGPILFLIWSLFPVLPLILCIMGLKMML
ncbi:MAG: hypothetical protein AAB975_04860, partial [Patescibacteria group bacterium]